MRKIIAIILTRVGPVEIARRDIEFDMVGRFTVQIEGHGQQGCTVNLQATAEGASN